MQVLLVAKYMINEFVGLCLKEELLLVCLQPFLLAERMCILVFFKSHKKKECACIEKASCNDFF